MQHPEYGYMPSLDAPFMGSDLSFPVLIVLAAVAVFAL